MPIWLKLLTVIPVVIDGVKFIVKTVKQRKKAKLTPAEITQAAKDAAAELDKIIEASRKLK